MIFKKFSLGIINLCKPGNSGIQSLIGVLCIPNMEIRVGKNFADYEKLISGDAFSS